MARRTRPPAVVTAFDAAFALVAPARPTPRGRRLHAMGAAIAAAIQAAPAPEPAYHDRHHTIEAIVAMAMLCRVGVAQGLICGDAAMLGVVGMAGHDLGHDGAVLPAGVMEARSALAVRAVLSTQDPDPADLAAIEALIAATDPALAPHNAATAHHLHQLANEADICASLLPRLGPKLSQLLAEEWRSCGDARWREVGTARGRLGFLLHRPPFSGPAVALGLAAAQAGCLLAYAAAGVALGAGSDAAEGCAALDRLPPAKARTVYAGALDTVWTRPGGGSDRH